MLALPFLRRILRKVPILPSRPPPVPPKSTPSPISSRLPGREYKTAQERPHNMDGVIIPSETVPNELKVACEQTLKRAKELKKAEPVVAYWCSFAAAQRALKVPSRSKEGTMWLMSLLDALEQMKAVLASNEAVTNEAAGAAYIENFALKVFMSADNDDRAGITGKATTRKFVVAGQFIEALRCFENGMTEEMEQKLQYSRWKAADGAKALREGRAPASGPPMPETEINPFPDLPPGSPTLDSASLALSPSKSASFTCGDRPDMPDYSTSNQTITPAVSPAAMPTDSSPRDIPNIDTSSRDTLRTPQRPRSSGSTAWSTVATPGVVEYDGDERESNIGPSAPPLTPPIAAPTTTERKNVRFMGPDGAPLSPASTYQTVDSYDIPPVPPPSTLISPPGSPHPSILPTPPTPPLTMSSGEDSSLSNVPPRVNGDERNFTIDSSGVTSPRGDGRDQQIVNDGAVRRSAGESSKFPPVPGVAPLPLPPPKDAYQPHPPPAVQTHDLRHTLPLPTSTPTRKQIDQTQKHAKWAISALEFDDVETAKSELRKALATIGG
ncbi:MAG: hypothetical protein TREMPRED_000412 [Tremellales sp. Tagirdzhanova-0007]|nr:MAG: hypothetical protein TREMPRED_000412 [Tremellales sp. Tagirdzhanova-0007]